MNLIASIVQILIIPLGIAVLYFMLVLCIMLKSFIKYQKTKQYYNDLPGYPGILPFYQIFAENGIKYILEQAVDEFGNLKACNHFVGSHLDGTATCFINDAEVFKEIFDEKKFPKLKILYNTLKVMLGNGLVTSTGEFWHCQRRLLNPLFHFSKLKEMPLIMNRRIDLFCSGLEDKGDVFVTELFSALTLEIVVDCIFGGERYLSSKELTPLWNTASIISNNYFIGDLVLGPTLNNVSPFPWNFKLRSTMETIRKLVKNAIGIKRREMKYMDCTEDSDLLASLLRVKNESTGEELTEDIIIDESLTFLFAGHDTTSSLLSWSMVMLNNREDIVKKAREEIKLNLGTDQANYKNIGSLPYCESILKETLRMRPPVPFLDREVSEDITIKGHTYKKGTYVYPILIAAHYDKRYWENPFEFKPERFLENRKKMNSYSFVPFSFGTRNCIGMKFAMLEAMLCFVEVIRKYDIVSPQQDNDIIWGFEGTIKPVNFKCSFKKIM